MNDNLAEIEELPVAKPRILVVDDERLFRETISMTLADEGFDVVPCDSGPAALDYLKTGAPADLVLLDWQMPEMDGLEVLRLMRDQDFLLPVIFLTGLGNQVFEEAALSRGAIDFVDKTRSFAIILHRIRLVVEGGKPSAGKPVVAQQAAQITLGPLNLRLDTSRAFWRGSMVSLTLTEFNVVRLLSERLGEDVSYREIYDLVHGRGFIAGSGEMGYRANVRALVKRIRQKFKEIDPDFAELENYPGFGYRWLDAANSR
jgi:two-component system response regulator ChvI